jgi:DNA-binding GntR family transcriptional regulator
MLTLKQHAYGFILERLQAGGIRPGARLSDDAIALEIGISRSPVREAIGQLASEGFLEYRPRKGAFVRSPDRREIERLYEARLALEGFVAAKAAERATDDDLAQLREITRRLRATVEACRRRPTRTADRRLLDRFLQADLEFHEKILSIVDNEEITAMVQKCQILARLFARVTMEHDLHLMAHTYRQHSLVLRAIRRRDSAAAARWMNYHIDKSAEAVLEQYDLH